MLVLKNIIIAAMIASLWAFAGAMHESYNFPVLPASRSCFYEDFEESTPVKLIDVFVESGGSLDIYLTVHGPLSLENIREETFEEYIYKEKVDATSAIGTDTSTFTKEIKPEETGTYAICLDNRVAHFITKYVQLDVRNAKRPEPVAVHIGGENESTDQIANGEEHKAEEAITRIRESMERVRKGLKRVQVQQQVDRHRLQLHSATNVLDNNKVVTGSVVETGFFIAAALFQILFVRRWFAASRGVADDQQLEPGAKRPFMYGSKIPPV